MHCSFKLIISEQNTLQCFIIKENQTEELITLNPIEKENKQKDKYPITISFTTNEVIVCEENKENQIEFMNDWKQNSTRPSTMIRLPGKR